MANRGKCMGNDIDTTGTLELTNGIDTELQEHLPRAALDPVGRVF